MLLQRGFFVTGLVFVNDGESALLTLEGVFGFFWVVIGVANCLRFVLTATWTFCALTAVFLSADFSPLPTELKGPLYLRLLMSCSLTGSFISEEPKTLLPFLSGYLAIENELRSKCSLRKFSPGFMGTKAFASLSYHIS
jgi:hypothetical protein